MKKIFIIFIITSLSLSGPLGSDSFSVGLGSETMGIYGMWNLNYQLNDIFFISAGSFLIPFFGGYGIGTKYNFTSSRVSPFMASSIFGAYMIPIMCENCEVQSDIILSGSIGLDIRIYKEFYINLGAVHLHSSGGGAPVDSPSDIPELWPFVNIRFGT